MRHEIVIVDGRAVRFTPADAIEWRIRNAERSRWGVTSISMKEVAALGITSAQATALMDVVLKRTDEVLDELSLPALRGRIIRLEGGGAVVDSTKHFRLNGHVSVHRDGFDGVRRRVIAIDHDRNLVRFNNMQRLKVDDLLMEAP